MKSRWILLFLTWAVLAGALPAEPLEIRFSTLPPDCTIADLNSPNRPASLGDLMVERPAPGGSLRFRLFKPGYSSLEVTIPENALPAGDKLSWPSRKGSFLRLEPLLVRATFFTSPSGAQIWTSRSGRSDDYLGSTGTPLLLNLADLMGGSSSGSFRVRLTAPGYQSVEIPVPQHLFGADRPNRWPAEGEYALAPTEGMFAPLMFQFRLKPWTGSLMLVAFLSFALLVGRLAHRSWASLRRAHQLESRLAKPGTNLAGSLLGPYRLFEVIGRGATATVFRGVLENERAGGGGGDLAIKVFNLGGDAPQRLAHEVRPLLDLRHPNLVGLLDWGQADRFAYLVTELVPGRTLRQELEHGPLQLERWRGLVDDLLGGLAHAHQRGVTHGDIKPENILIPWHGKSKLVDFGLARRNLHPGLERFGGTPGYMAPESMAQQRSTERSDQFAAGTVLFEALFGFFPGAPDWQPLRLGEVARILLKMRLADPGQRFHDVEEARQALQSCSFSD